MSELVVDDLHVDEIDKYFLEKEKWIFGAKYCLKAGVDILSETQLPLKALFAFSLRSKEKFIGVNFGDLEELKNEFNHTPPSLYLFSNKNDSWVDINDKLVKIDFLDFNIDNLECNYLEYKEPDDCEFRRSLWLEIKL
jgi:hypothetical protein